MSRASAQAAAAARIQMGRQSNMHIRKLAEMEHGKTRSLYEEVFSEDSSSSVSYTHLTLPTN